MATARRLNKFFGDGSIYMEDVQIGRDGFLHLHNDTHDCIVSVDVGRDSFGTMTQPRLIITITKRGIA